MISRDEARRTLGVSPTDPDDVVCAAYRKIAIDCHPPSGQHAEWSAAARQRFKQAGLAYQRLCPDCREIDTSDSDDSADYGEGEIFDIFNAVMQSTSKGEDVHLPARNHPQRDAAAPASHRYRSAYENYDTPSSSDDHASEPECVDEHKEHAQHLKRGGAWDEASCSIGHGRDGARLNAYAARATHQNYDSLSSDEESGESGPDADVKYDQHAPRASYDCVKDFTAEDVEDALENLEEEKASLHAELQKMLQQNPRNEQRCKIMEAFQKGQLALKRRRNFFIRKRDELGQSGTEVKVSDEFSLAQQRADAAMRELLEEEEQEKKKAQHRGDDRDKTLQAEASGLPAPEDQEGTAEVIGREAAQGREAADLGEGDGDGRKLSKSERKKLLEEKRAEALRQKKAEKRFLQRQRRKQERDEALGGRAADGGDELDLTSAFALSNKAADKSAAGNGAPRFRGSRVIVMHADVTVEAHEQAACGGRPEEPKEGKRKAKLKKKRPAPSDPSNAATGHSVESEQAAAACMTSSTQGSRADVSAHDSGSRSADSFHPAPEEDPASKLRDMGFSDQDIQRAARATWRESTVDAMLEYLLLESTQQHQAVDDLDSRAAEASPGGPSDSSSAPVMASVDERCLGEVKHAPPAMGEPAEAAASDQHAESAPCPSTTAGRADAGARAEDAEPTADVNTGSDGAASQAPGPYTLQIGNIDRAVTDKDLMEALRSYSDCMHIKFVKSSRAVVTLSSGASARAAMSALDGKCVGKSLKPLIVSSVMTPHTAGVPVPVVRDAVEETGGRAAPSGVQNSGGLPDVAPSDAPLAAAKLKANVKAERHSQVSAPAVAGGMAAPPGAKSHRLASWHALDALNAFDPSITAPPSDVGSGSISSAPISGASISVAAAAAEQQSHLDTDGLADRYNRMLLGKALLAFEGYAQAENIQRWSGALNSPKTATIFEKWKRLPVSGSIHGVIGQNRPSRKAPDAAPEHSTWPAPPPLDRPDPRFMIQAVPIERPIAQASPLLPASAPSVDLAANQEPNTGMAHRQMMQGMAHALAPLPANANAFGPYGWNGVFPTPNLMPPHTDATGDHQVHHQHQPYWGNPFYSMPSPHQQSTGFGAVAGASYPGAAFTSRS